MDENQIREIEKYYKNILELIGENPDREGLIKTPKRVARSLDFLTSGYKQDPVSIIKSAIFHEDHHNIVAINNIPFYSMCEHHMLPFFGTVSIGYIPNGTIAGLSKFPRVVDALSRRLQVQERLTKEILSVINEALDPRGVIVTIKAQHMCMQMRGVEKSGSETLTISYSGCFDDHHLRQEFISMTK